MTDHLLVDVDPVTGVATVTLDRPHAMNAFTQSMLEAIGRFRGRTLCLPVRSAGETGSGRS